ncbi:Rv3654c family TadE-like protein [Actinosynnema sp. NPDC059797]
MRRWWVGDDRGTASVLAVAVAGVWFGLVLVGVHVGAAVVDRHRVAAAADLAALAAAGHLVSGVRAACGRAELVVGRMGGRLAGCEVDGWEVSVLVVGEPSVGGGARLFGGAPLFGAPSARARAGPAEG